MKTYKTVGNDAIGNDSWENDNATHNRYLFVYYRVTLGVLYSPPPEEGWTRHQEISPKASFEGRGRGGQKHF